MTESSGTESVESTDEPPIACTLTGEAMDDRSEWIDEHLGPTMRAVEDHDDGFTFVLDRDPETYAAATELAWMESSCCAWATVEVALPPGGDTIRWIARSERAEGRAYFDEALDDAREAFDR